MASQVVTTNISKCIISTQSFCNSIFIVRLMSWFVIHDGHALDLAQHIRICSNWAKNVYRTIHAMLRGKELVQHGHFLCLSKPVRFRLLSPYGEQLRQDQKVGHGTEGSKICAPSRYKCMQMRSVRFCSLANKSCWSNSQLARECSESRFQEVYIMQMPF